MEKTRKVAETKQSKVLFRGYTLDPSTFDEEKRTVEIAFSSETPVNRYDGDEILDHGEGSVRLDRIKSDGPLLVDHDWSDHIGTVEDVRIDADRIGRAVVRFGKSARASEILQDVLDGIRKSISVGYRIHKVVHETRESDNSDVYRVTDWEPLEFSFVSVPADTAVGVGRSSEQSENNYTLIRNEVIPMDKTESKAAEAEGVELREQAEKRHQTEIKKSRELEIDRQKGIRNLAAMHPGHDNLVTDALRSEKSVGDFSDELLEAVLKEREADVPDSSVDLTENEVQRYSICRAINAQVTGSWKDAEFEREISDHLAEKLEVEARGVLVPFEVQKREVTTTGPGIGGLGTDHLGGSFIDNLRDNSLLMGLGARSLTGLRGNIDIPRKTGNSTFSWIGEGVDSPESDVTIGTLSMSPKTVTGSVGMTRRTLLQLNPDIDSLVMADMGQGAALAVDIAGISGATGGDNPVGITNTTGVLTNTVATPGQPTWAECVNFETLVAAANAMSAGSSYITTAAVRGYMKTAKKDAGSGIFLIEGNECNGYDVNVKTDAGFAANSILFGDFSQLLVAMWGTLDVVADTSTNVASNGLIIRMFQDLDFAVRQPTAFVVNA